MIYMCIIIILLIIFNIFLTIKLYKLVNKIKMYQYTNNLKLIGIIKNSDRIKHNVQRKDIRKV